MTIFDPHHRQMHELAETTRKTATSSRMGTVKEVKQAKGERKIRVVIGVDPNGKELLGPWMNTTEHRGATRGQKQYKKGQNVRISGVDGDYRQATVTPWAEGDSFPQPDHAEEHGYGDSTQAGKIHTGTWMPEEDEQQEGGQQGGGGGQQKEKNHRHETWIATEDNKPPAHSGKSRQEIESGDGSSSKDQQQQGQQQQKQKKKLEAAMMVSLDEKNGYTARVGKDVRVAAHSQGAKIRAGGSYFAAEKDKDAKMYAKKDIYVRSDGENYVDKPWVIKRGPDENIPNDDKLGNKG